MKITIEPTNKYQPQPYSKSSSIDTTFPVVTVEIPEDHMTISEVFDCIIIPALQAYGFHSSAIDNYLFNEPDNTTV